MPLIACWGLPEDFSSLTLDKKIDAYERHLRWGGGINYNNARSWIAWHGHEAAERMVPYIRQEKRGLPLLEALAIVWDVSARGCDLRGSAVESALKDLIAIRRRTMGNAEFITAESALRLIERYAPLEPGRLNTLPEGPCEREYLARKKLLRQDSGVTPDNAATEPKKKDEG